MGKKFLQDKVELNKAISLQSVAYREGEGVFHVVLWLHWGSDKKWIESRKGMVFCRCGRLLRLTF